MQIWQQSDKMFGRDGNIRMSKNLTPEGPTMHFTQLESWFCCACSSLSRPELLMSSSIPSPLPRIVFIFLRSQVLSWKMSPDQYRTQALLRTHETVVQLEIHFHVQSQWASEHTELMHLMTRVPVGQDSEPAYTKPCTTGCVCVLSFRTHENACSEKVFEKPSGTCLMVWLSNNPSPTMWSCLI